MNAMLAAAAATRRAVGVDRLGVEPLLGELDEDEVDDDEPDVCQYLSALLNGAGQQPP